jgi:hypothetical protein
MTGTGRKRGIWYAKTVNTAGGAVGSGRGAGLSAGGATDAGRTAGIEIGSGATLAGGTAEEILVGAGGG